MVPVPPPGPCPSSLAPPQTLTSPPVSLFTSRSISLSHSVSRAHLPSAAPHPFSWREARRFPFLRARPPRRQHRAFCTSCFNSCRAPFPPQDLPARPPMGGQVSSPGSFSGLPYASKANADWMSALNSRLWDVPLHQLSIPGEAPRARLSGKAAARWSVCAKPQCQTCTHAGTHTCMHTHTHTTHTHAHTHRTHMHTGIHAHTVHTHTHTHTHTSAFPSESTLSPFNLEGT